MLHVTFQYACELADFPNFDWSSLKKKRYLAVTAPVRQHTVAVVLTHRQVHNRTVCSAAKNVSVFPTLPLTTDT